VTRANYRFRNYHIVPDTGPSAEPHSFTAQCATCDETGYSSQNSDHAQAWVERHLKANPQHLTYRQIITLPYRAEPGEWS
jgi:hypothetical protein